MLGKSEVVPFIQPVHAERLVKLDMPELDLDPRQSRFLDLHDARSDEWIRWYVERYSIDGRVRIRNVHAPEDVEWVDLSRKRYRWVM